MSAHYKVAAESLGQSNYYFDVSSFEIHSSDVSEVSIRAHRAAVLSGTVVIEGIPGPDSIAALSALKVSAQPRSVGGIDSPQWPNPAPVAADGSFELIGVGPGRYGISAGVISGPGRLAISRVEINGSVQHSVLSVGPGDQISGIKIVMIPANRAINGRLVLIGGDAAMQGLGISASVVEDSTGSSDPEGNLVRANVNRWVRPSLDGTFHIGDLPPGVYSVRLVLPDGQVADQPDSELSQTVTVSSGADAQVTFTLSIGQKAGRMPRRAIQ